MWYNRVGFGLCEEYVKIRLIREIIDQKKMAYLRESMVHATGGMIDVSEYLFINHIDKRIQKNILTRAVIRLVTSRGGGWQGDMQEEKFAMQQTQAQDSVDSASFPFVGEDGFFDMRAYLADMQKKYDPKQVVADGTNGHPTIREPGVTSGDESSKKRRKKRPRDNPHMRCPGATCH